MVTINGVKAQNLQADKNEDIKPSMNDILSRMQTNYDNMTQSQSFSKEPQSTNQNSNTESITSIFQGENGILFELLPLLLNKDNENLSQEIMTKMLAKSGNPMLSKLMTMLPKINKKAQSQKTDDSKEPTQKIDDFVKTEK